MNNKSLEKFVANGNTEVLSPVDLGDCPSLKEFVCWGILSWTPPKENNIEVLSVRSFPESFRLSDFPKLRKLEVEAANINASRHAALEEITLSENASGGDGLLYLDVSYATALKYINCQRCSNIRSINAEGCSSLERLDASYEGNNRLAGLNIEGCSSLRAMALASCAITMLDLGGCTALDTLRINNLLSLKELKMNGHLKALYCTGTVLTQLDISGYERLEHLLFSNNSQTQSLNLKGCQSLKGLSCDNNGSLASLNLSDCIGLKQLDCSNNALSGILDLGKQKQLERVSCSGNPQLTKLILYKANVPIYEKDPQTTIELVD